MASDPSDLDIFGYIASLEEECLCNPVGPQCAQCNERIRLTRMLGSTLLQFRMHNDLDWLDPSVYELAMGIPF